MRKIILFCVIQQLLYHNSRVESLIGEQNFIPIIFGELPFIATFQSFPDGSNFCEGALITKKHVITAAFCLEYVPRERFRILFEVADGQAPAVAYTVASWTTFVGWAIRHDIPYDDHPVYNLAIVQLTDRVCHVNPVPLSGLTKEQLYGTMAIMTGRQNDVLSKANLMLLSNQNCQNRTHVLINDPIIFNDRVLCGATDPFALLEVADLGSPLIHARDKTLVGIAFGCSPGDEYVHGNFSTDFIRQHQVNVYYNIHFYRLFIHSIIPAIPAA